MIFVVFQLIRSWDFSADSLDIANCSFKLILSHAGCREIACDSRFTTRRRPALSTFHLEARGIPLLARKNVESRKRCSERNSVSVIEHAVCAVQVHDEMDSPRLFVICSGERKRNTISRRVKERSLLCAPRTVPREQTAIDRKREVI